MKAVPLHSYTPYGYLQNDFPHQQLLGFNGELLERYSETYQLGNGYRLYSPVTMRFVAPDSWSPFGKGGGQYLWLLRRRPHKQPRSRRACSCHAITPPRRNTDVRCSYPPNSSASQSVPQQAALADRTQFTQRPINSTTPSSAATRQWKPTGKRWSNAV